MPSAFQRGFSKTCWFCTASLPLPPYGKNHKTYKTTTSRMAPRGVPLHPIVCFALILICNVRPVRPFYVRVTSRSCALYATNLTTLKTYTHTHSYMHKHSRILLVHSHHNTNGTNAPKLQTQFGDEHFKTKPLQPSRFTFRIQPLSPGALLPRNGVLLFLGKAHMSSEQANCKYNFHQPYAHLVDNQPRPQQANANAPVFCPEPTPFVSFVHPVPKATNNCEKYAQAIVSLFRSLCSCFFLSPRLCTSVPCTLQSSCVKSFVQISVFFV